LALMHDVFIMIAVFSIFRIEVDITIIAAVLTIVGYSINDTIVTLDRIRENLRKIKVIKSEETVDLIINRSLRQTATRSINTVLTVVRSEEHTSELQSRFDLVCRLLLEKKK